MTTQRFSIHAALLSVLALNSAGTLAQSRAVEALNFELGLATQDIDTSGSTSTGALGVNAAGTVPLGRYFGVAVSAGYSEANVRTRDVLVDESGSVAGTRTACDFDGTNGRATLFARRPTLGKLAVSYGSSRVSPSCGDASHLLATDDDKLRADHYRVDAEIYLGNFTLAAGRTSTELDRGPKLESSSVRASWYPLANLLVSVSGNDLYEQDTYGITLEHQPEFMGDALGVRLGYAATEDDPRTRTISLGISYYFGTRVELKVRDRQYR